MQELPDATVLPQVVDTNENSDPATEAADGTVTERGPTPVLVSVATALLDAPTAVAAKFGLARDAA